MQRPDIDSCVYEVREICRVLSILNEAGALDQASCRVAIGCIRAEMDRIEAAERELVRVPVVTLAEITHAAARGARLRLVAKTGEGA